MFFIMEPIIDGSAETFRSAERNINETRFTLSENTQMEAAESQLYASRVEVSELRAQIEAEIREQIKADLMSEVGIEFYQTT